MSKISVSRLLKMKQDGQRFTAITAYDASFARLFDDEGVQVLLIGDSLGMVLQGHGDTLPRITSYNVCYTKLLRPSPASRSARTPSRCSTA